MSTDQRNNDPTKLTYGLSTFYRHHEASANQYHTRINEASRMRLKSLAELLVAKKVVSEIKIRFLNVFLAECIAVSPLVLCQGNRCC